MQNKKFRYKKKLLILGTNNLNVKQGKLTFQ